MWTVAWVIVLMSLAWGYGWWLGGRECAYLREELSRVTDERNALRVELRRILSRLKARLEEKHQNTEGG